MKIPKEMWTDLERIIHKAVKVSYHVNAAFSRNQYDQAEKLFTQSLETFEKNWVQSNENTK